MKASKREEVKRAARAIYELQAQEESLALREEQVKAREERVRQLEEEFLKLELDNENLRCQLLAIRNDETTLAGTGSALPAVELTVPAPVAATAWLESEWLEDLLTQEE